MKSVKSVIRPTSFLLILLILIQACSVYHPENISLDQAVNNGAVRIQAANAEKLKFQEIIERGDEYSGLVKLNSRTSKKLQELGIIGRAEGKFYSFPLEGLQIQNVQAKNESASTLVSIGVGVVGAFLLVLVVAAISFSGGGYGFAW